MKKIFTLISAVMLCLGASAQTQKLADVIKATMDTCQHEIVPVFLTKYVTYELDSQVELGQKGVIIWGGEATIIVKGEGQIATQGYLQVRNANFDCAEGTVAPIALSATPDESLRGSEAMFEGANTNVFYNNHKVSVVKCNFRELKTSLFYTNKASWALNTLELDRNIVQLNISNDLPVINYYDSSNGAIKHIILTGNVIYNIDQANEKSYGMIRYKNTNSQPQKIWGAAGTSDFVMTNNTISLPGKAFANNFPNRNNVTLDWKKNIFVNTPLLQKIGQNSIRNFTAEDNTLFNNNGKALDATDLSKFGTEDKAAGLDVPAEPLDFANIAALEESFKPNFVSQTTYKQNGAYVIPFKTDVLKTPGCNFELILGPDLLAQYTIVANCSEADLGKEKPGINTDLFPWVKYVRDDDKNVLSNGQNEAQQSNRWTDLNPTTGEQGTFIQVAGKNGSVNSPVLGANIGKSIKLYVKDIASVEVFATGSASGSAADGNAIVLNVTSTDGSTDKAMSLPGSIFGKGTASACVNISLKPDAAHEISIESANKDIQITGIRLYSDDETKFPVCHAPGEKAPGTNYEVVLGPDMLAQYALVDNPEVTKPGINVEEYPWITYVREDGLNILENGQNEAQQSNRWTDLNPTTGEKGTWLQATGKNGSVNSPVISAEWKKHMIANIMDATKFRVYATGSASTTAATGDQLILTATGNDGSVITAATTPGTIWGKGKGSDYAELTLNPNRAYTIKIETAVKDMQITGFNITGTDLSIAPAEDNPGLGDATGIENVENNNVDANAPAYNIAGQRVNGAAKGLIIKGGKKYIIR